MEKHHPEDLRYTKEHEWCRIDGDVATVGITWHAQDSLGDIVYCELPNVDEDVSAGQTFGVVESVKAVSDLFSPLTGTVVERNDAVIESPEGLNEDPYDDGWLIKIKLKDPAEAGQLMSKDEYEKFIEDSADS